MKLTLVLTFLGLLALLTPASNAAEGLPAKADTPTLVDRPIVVPSEIPPPRPELPAHPARPPARPHPPESVSAMISSFKDARKAFLANQTKLRVQLKEAGEEERDAIREQLKENLRNWISDQRERALEARAQAQEMRDRIKDITPVIDASPEGGRN